MELEIKAWLLDIERSIDEIFKTAALFHRSQRVILTVFFFCRLFFLDLDEYQKHL